MARTTEFDQAIWEEVIDRLSTGEPLVQICRYRLEGEDLVPRTGEHFPHRSTVHNWKNADPLRLKQFEDAKDDGYDSIAARGRHTARGKTVDKGGDSTGDVQRDKLIIETDHKLLRCWDPKRYGDKMDLNVDATVRGSVSYRANIRQRNG